MTRTARSGREPRPHETGNLTGPPAGRAFAERPPTTATAPDWRARRPARTPGALAAPPVPPLAGQTPRNPGRGRHAYAIGSC
jgi:hypothetical protein